MAPTRQSRISSGFAGFAPLIIGLMALGCDNISARPFGGNTAAGGQSAGESNGPLGRGQGGRPGIIAISTPAGGASGGDTATPEPTGGAVGAAVAAAGARGTLPSGTGGLSGGGGTVAVSGGPGGSTAANGGNTGTAGVPPNAADGISASGGATGAGGVAPPGGATSTGGATITGGATGSGGTMGSGGANVVPGTGGGPAAGGSGGSDTPSNKVSCSQYISDYDAALAKAKICTGSGNSCSKLAPAALSGCTAAACNVHVDQDAMLTDIRQKWVKAGCVAGSCPIAVCVIPTSGSCSMSAGSDNGNGNDKKGTCTDTLLGL